MEEKSPENPENSLELKISRLIGKDLRTEVRRHGSSSSAVVKGIAVGDYLSVIGCQPSVMT